MKSVKGKIAVSVVLVCILGCALLLLHRGQKLDGKTNAKETESAQLARVEPTSVSREGADSAISNGSVNMSPWEFTHLRVHLPKPVDGPWKAAVFDSQTCFHPNVKLTAVRALSGWIRKAVLTGNDDLAGRYLWTLLKFTDDTNQEVKTAAVLSLYQMGDSNGAALAKMKEWIANGADFRVLSSDFGVSNIQDIRERVLQETKYYNDTNLVATVYDVWAKNKDNEDESVGSLDYAYYLENQGVALPTEYWMDRLKTTHALEHTLNVLEERKPEGVTEALQSLFDQLQAAPMIKNNGGKAAKVALALFQLSGNTEYRDYIARRADAQLASGTINPSLSMTLNALAATNEESSLVTLSSALQNSNVVVRQTAIDALGSSQNPKAADILYETAIEDSKTRFPRAQLQALLKQNNPASDAKYLQLQNALLAGQLGWRATTSDFAGMEAFRLYGRANLDK